MGQTHGNAGEGAAKKRYAKRGMMRYAICALFAAFFVFTQTRPASLFAQNAGGFNPFADAPVPEYGAEGEGAAAPQIGGFSVAIGGKLSAGFTGYIKDFAENAGGVRLGDVVSADLNFFAYGDRTEAAIKLKFVPRFDGGSPVTLEEAYSTVFLYPFMVSAGLRKLAWGKADVDGPLDVINPQNYADLTELASMENIGQALKIARPMLHALFELGGFSRVEAVFVPWFAGHQFADTGRWKPLLLRDLEMLARNLLPAASPQNAEIIKMPDTGTLENFQAGARFTMSFSYIDFGLQYYYGLLPRPAYALTFSPQQMSGAALLYNRYHQAGFDLAAGLFGFNVRAEAALNLTEDFAGTDPSVYNPHVAWSLGFDRPLWGFRLNLQLNEKIRLFNNGVGDSLFDVEAGTKPTSTRLISELSYGFLRDTVRLKFRALWDIEDADALLIPAIVIAHGDAELELTGGIFTGSRTGEFGQYRDNTFAKATLRWKF
ncbi:MAG: hypothetical protein LBD20_06130 [Spirochaetaceae bacterium]|nr:hypothetical protein [Spirochaetaceae bacterium]